MQNDPQENGQASSFLPSSIELLTRSTASALLIVYALGFVILTFHDAKYGVVQFSPFRARIVLVGFVFTMLVTLAAAAQHYGLAYLGVLELVIKDSAPNRRLRRDTLLAAGFVYTASIMSSIFGSFLFLHYPVAVKPNQPYWHILARVAASFIAFGLFWLAARTYLKKPNLAVFLSVLALAIFCADLVAPGLSSPQNYLTLMLALVGWHTTFFKWEKSAFRFALDFRNWFTVLMLIWIYISLVFGDMPQRWGGGQPTPVQIFQIAPSVWTQSNPMDALLLDETDEGLYVLLSPTGKAFFVPKNNVASIFFGTREELTRK